MTCLASLQPFFDASVHMVGFVFVLFVLTTIWIVLECMGGLFKQQKKQQEKKVAVAVPTVAADPDAIDDDELVVIASTVALMLGQRRHRLVSIRTRSSSWSQEGRRQHLHSHRIKK